jgi:shikimate kinase
VTRPRNLVLVGFMGSGKTAIGRCVAPRLGLRFVDLDEVIVAGAGKSILDIFRDAGEPEFRRLERDAVRRVAAGSGQVIAPGGGAVINAQSWKLLGEGNVVVRLDASPRALLRRIRRREERRDSSGARPRDIRPLADVPSGAGRWPTGARRRVLDLMREREELYVRAPHTVNTTGRSRAETCRAVASLARDQGLAAVSAVA